MQATQSQWMIRYDLPQEILEDLFPEVQFPLKSST